MGEKRTRELFNTAEFLQKTITEIKKSDDFAGFVYDIWTRHNFESSEARRKRPKAILENAVVAPSLDFENFTRIITVAQQITVEQVRILEAFYSTEAHKFSDHVRSRYDYELSATQILDLIDKTGIASAYNIPTLNQLCYLGVLGTYIAMNGEYYKPVQFGKVFLDYIKS